MKLKISFFLLFVLLSVVLVLSANRKHLHYAFIKIILYKYKSTVAL